MISMDISTILLIASLSFLTALTGAMSPGPLFTYTIIKSIQKKKRGYLMAIWIILGHALLEIVVILVLLAGFSYFITDPIVILIIGIVGCIVLIIFGSLLIKDLVKNEIPTDFLDQKIKPDNNKNELSNTEILTADQGDAESKEKKPIDNPVIGGILVSMANPYWWIWWATFGITFMIEYDITTSNLQGFIAFYIGHEMGDLIWYLLISIMASLGVKKFNKKIYYSFLYFCAIFMIGFGLYLGISVILKYAI
jgi:threonine/homoserine/homoserine lactone efflux protein